MKQKILSLSLSLMLYNMTFFSSLLYHSFFHITVIIFILMLIIPIMMYGMSVQKVLIQFRPPRVKVLNLETSIYHIILIIVKNMISERSERKMREREG